MMDSSANTQSEQKPKKLVKAFASSESGKTRVLLVGADWYYMCSDLSCAFSDVEGLHTQLLDMYTRVNREDDLIFSCLASQHDKEILAYKEYSSKPGREEVREFNPEEDPHILCKFKDYGAYNLATWKIINYYLKKLYEEIEKEDSVLIYFAGHGAEVGGKSYFLPLDAIREDLGATINVECAISIDEIINELSNCEAKCKWLVVDTCRAVVNGIETKQDTGEFLKTEVVKDVVVFQSCSSGEVALEEYDARGKHGAFSILFLDALKGTADIEKKGYITISDVWKHVSKTMERKKRNQNNTHYHNGYCKQNPDSNIKDYEDKDFVICDHASELENAEKKLKEAKARCREGKYKLARDIAWQVRESTAGRKNAKEIKLNDEAEELYGYCMNMIDENPQDENQKSTEKNKNERSSFLMGEERNRKTIDVGGQKFTFCFCPPGTFMMGSPEEEEGHKKNERQHKVTFTKGFWMLESEVTQAQWEAIMEKNPSCFKGPNLPVDSVSLVDCRNFIDKLNRQSPMQDGFEFKLPTESQWEYACRAGSQGAYSGVLDEMGWYYGNTEGTTTHEVKGKKPNAWGLYDMHGNLYEWCSDGYEDYPSGSVTDHRAPSSSFGQYVNRGGKYSSDAVFCRSAFRGHNASWEHDEGLGVRIILESSDRQDAHDEKPKETEETVEIIDSDDVPKSGSSRTIKLGEKSWVFRYCEPGEFDMGSPDDEGESSVNGRRRRVLIDHGFWMLETPVTQDLYYAVRWENPSFHQGKEIFNGKEEFVEYPVENVSWEDSRLFAYKLNDRFKDKLSELSSDGKLKFRLPTEAEWEYACFAGEEGFHAGDLEERGWYKNNSDGHTHRVKLKAPNNWKLYDMHGNVGEWCLDMYRENLNKDPAIDPVTLPMEDTRERVVRSGDGFAGDACDQRSFSRTGASINEANSHLGFRLVLSSFDPEGKSRDGSKAESNH